MAKTVAIGIQDFEKIRERNVFYIDKTKFIREWWESQDDVTLITRPRRFGKTLTIRMTEQFFSVNYQGRGDLFEGLDIWKEEKYRALQGSYPVISLSFANVKENSYPGVRKQICQALTEIYNSFDFLLDGDYLNTKEKEFFDRVSADMEEKAQFGACFWRAVI